MKLILAVDAIVPPLTGIGRYTWELARHYTLPQIGLDQARFFFAGRWVEDPASLLQPATAQPRRRKGLLPRMPASWRRWNMRRQMRSHVFHSPNYFLPDAVDGGIVTVHDLSVFKYPETHPAERLRHFEQGFASTLKRAAHLITDSEAVRAEVVEYFGWPRDKVTAIRLGVPTEFGPRPHAELRAALEQYGLAPGAYALCVSTLEPRKRVDRLLTAYGTLPSALRESCPLVLAGSKGWLSDGLQEQIARGQSEGWLHYLGFVPEPVLPLLYAGARAFLYPSVYEGFGLPVLEALASGVPTLTSDCSSLPEVADGAAWLVQPDDHAALCEGIAKVLSDEAWRAQAVERGLQVAQQHSWARCAAGTLEVCRQFA
ncbi:glycosyltransferase family 4 protein [Ralstonia thomasii]|jgi:glycosyltransferase involved in cell wall biosynthesis|uniref:D-inositol-3-phosphate glycosyltransferase n=2 Tax=Ralstonia TaxID=48736 RepID=A0AAD2BUH9_9RALS|nr:MULTISPECIES: glycosyltransferase family 1 protein [Ralstonia]MBT2178700.1 glycosyltransferase family 4 protein [Ralstonia pickettii]OCS48916.1 transcription elongation factor GreAB [Ralstonia pickettii]CAJ0710030.1 D-inositol-3-phosphate glycosyltransferase [Ralstonia sp. LMG 18095]CAJ0785793.1 D-inositol-3-phosphate glycosyltransferase [Ralstonia sp. LMG 18095]CAJ0808068.1 D-inositol-3-phosphate glycosyltransferase [Ralstonia sp. LMG 18095]